MELAHPFLTQKMYLTGKHAGTCASKPLQCRICVSITVNRLKLKCAEIADEQPPTKELPERSCYTRARMRQTEMLFWKLTRHDDVKCIMPVQNIVVRSSEAGERIDTFLAKRAGITRSQVQKFIVNGAVFVNEMSVSRNYRLKVNDADRLQCHR